MPLWRVVINLLFAKLDQNRGAAKKEKRWCKGMNGGGFFQQHWKEDFLGGFFWRYVKSFCWLTWFSFSEIEDTVTRGCRYNWNRVLQVELFNLWRPFQVIKMILDKNFVWNVSCDTRIYVYQFLSNLICNVVTSALWKLYNYN